MIGAASAYIAGSFFAFLFTPWLSAVVAGTLFAAALLVLHDRRELIRDLAMIMLCWAVGFSAYSGYNALRCRPALSLDGTTGSFSGTVEDFTVYSGDSASYILKGKANGKVPCKVVCYTDDLGARLGDLVTVDNCDFSAITGDYLYNSKDNYKAQRIFLTVSGGTSVLTEMHARPVRNALRNYREKMIGKFRSELGEDAGSFLAGMIFGEKQGIDPEIKTALYRSGIGHILAVSGLHVSLIAALIMWLMQLLRVNRFVSFGVMDAAVIILLILANSPVSAIRAAIMVNLMYLAGLFLRQNDPLNSLAIAALLICIVNPFSIHSAGFWLSLSGTFGIAVLAPYLTRELPQDTLSGKLLLSFLTALITTISVFPLSLLYFDEVSAISPITNVLLVPLCTLAMILGLIFVVSGGFLPMLSPAGVLLDFVIKVTDLLGSKGVSHIADPGRLLSCVAMISGAAVISVYFITQKRRAVVVAISAAVVVFSCTLLTQTMIRRNTFRIAVLGKGSSAAIVVSCSGRRDVFDLSGNYRNPQYVRKYLMCDGADKADSIVLTRNIQAQYSAYASCLSFFPSQTWIASGETPVFGGEEVQLYGEEGFSFSTDDYSAEMVGETLTINRNGTSISFSPAAEISGESDLAVCYGEISRGTQLQTDGTIYLDTKPGTDYRYSGINNFEMTITKSGIPQIRRL